MSGRDLLLRRRCSEIFAGQPASASRKRSATLSALADRKFSFPASNARRKLKGARLAAERHAVKRMQPLAGAERDASVKGAG